MVKITEMKATLNFDLEDLDDKMAHQRCVKATDMALVLWELSYNFRKKFEAEIEKENHTDYEIVEMFYKGFYELMEEHGIILDDLIN